MIPCPLSRICSSLRPPPLAMTAIEVEPASRLFSSISLRAEAGLWMTSPAAILLTTSWSRAWMRGAPPAILSRRAAEKAGLCKALQTPDKHRASWPTSVRVSHNHR